MKPAPSLTKKKSSLKIKPKEKSFPIVAIGASAGGLDAMRVLLKNVSPTTGMAFIYAQHLSPYHKSFLASILAKTTLMKVQEIDNMELIKPNNVYVIPYNKGIKVTDGHIKLLPRSKDSSVISIDVLFSSLAETHKKNVIGIILSGNAHDGTIGLKAIKNSGGITFAQDDSAQASSMPESAIASGAVDFILSPKEIALKLAHISKNGFLTTAVKENRKEIDVVNNNSDLKTIFELLHKETGVDFSHYKMPTIKRRLNHKMLLSGVKTIKEYTKLLLKSNNEANTLYKDLLIHVTSFFRDAEAFLYLKKTFLPRLLKSKAANETLRIWVPACSSGEEAYSIAMLITELQDKKARKIPVKIFATDLSDQLIHNARIGQYSQSDMASVSKERMHRFFTKTGDTYFIVEELRKMCVFASHNILRDPPFSRMDFISCRNLLIYFDSTAQKKVFSTLHFALNNGGYLMLGKAETAGTSSQLFTQLNNKFKIYCRKKNTGILKIPELTPRFPPGILLEKNMNPIIDRKFSTVNPVALDSAIDAALLSRYMPACAIINKDMEILSFRGSTSFFLSHSSGKASLNILKMTRPEFAFELRNAIHKATKTKRSILKSDIEIKVGPVFRMVSLEVSPLKIEWDEPLLLIVFTVQEQVEKFTSSEKNSSTKKDRRIKKLTEELNITRTEMNSIIEAQETTHEELQAVNEETVSTNEEFQTLNEELETSKEEIQATNEELVTTNQNLQTRNDLLTESYEYSEAIIATIHEPMLVLNKDFHVKSANKSFYKKFLVKKEETEGMFLFELGNNQWNIPKLRKLLNDILSKNENFENFEVTHIFPGIGEKIMKLNAHLIVQKTHSEQLILLAIEDITEKKRIENKLRLSLKEISDYKSALDEFAIVAITDQKGIIQHANNNFCKISKYTREELIGKDHRIINSGYHTKEFIRNLWTTIAGGKIWKGELKNKAKDGTVYWVNTTIVPFLNEQGKPYQYVAVRTDITAQKNIEKELSDAKISAESATKIANEEKNKAESAREIAEVAVKSKQQFLSNMSHEIRTPMNSIIGFTKVVLKTNLSSKQKEYLNAIKSSGDSLIVLINDILDLAKVDSGKIQFEQAPFNLIASIEDMLHVFEPKLQEKNLILIKKYSSGIPRILAGDSMRLRQIILNLVSNAVKFTEKGKIIISIIKLKENAEKIAFEFSVTDTGIGIPKNKLGTIFDAFNQASIETTRKYGGSGLGLAIVKQLVELQNGTLIAKSKVGEGSTFGFTLSFNKTKEKLQVEPELKLNPITDIKNVKVLVVEDIVLNQLLMKTILIEFGFELHIAANGKIAIEKMKNNNYDIILMDLQMPEMDGFETTKYIRNKMLSKVPIIALTANVTSADVEKCKAVGMNDYISKPIDEKLLYNKIIKHLVAKIQLKK